MKAIKISKKSIIILICIISLIAIGIVVSYFINKKINNPYGVKVVDLPIPMEYEHYNFSGSFFKKYIENADDFNNVFDNRYAELSDEQKKNYKSDKLMFRKYNDKFFEKNFVYVMKTSMLYYGESSNKPRLKMTKCFYSKEKQRLIIEAKAIGEIQPRNVPMYVSNEPIGDWHGYIIEFPRSVFEEHDLTYDDIQITYTNMGGHWTEDSQLGLDKYFNDPDYPRRK